MKRTPLMLLPWLLAPLLELPFAYQAVARPELWRVLVELGVFAGLGVAQWRLAPEGPLRSGWIPAVLLVLGGVWLHLPAGLLTAFCFGVGVLVLAGVFVRVSESFGAFWVGLLALLPGVAIQRVLVLSGSYVGDPVGQLKKEVAGWFSRTDGPTTQGPPVLLITVDTLRADEALSMQSAQRIADGGALWPRAMATSSWTLPSLASTMTGLLPGEHGAGASGVGYQSVNAEVPLLAEELAAAGYNTAAFVANPFASSSTGMDRGFEDFFHVNERAAHRLVFGGRPVDQDSYWDSEVLVDRAVAHIASGGAQGGFIWLHLLDVHLPHRHAPRDSSVWNWRRSDYLNAGIVGSQQRQDTRAGYAGEVAYVDAQILRVLDALAAQGLEEQAVIVLTADHGEELWDHGGFEHGHTHAGVVVDVPLALRHPGFVEAGAGVASLVDIAPTLRAVAGLEPRGIDLAQGVPAQRIALAVGNKYMSHEASARRGDLRVVRPQDGPAWQVDLAVDPTGQVRAPVSDLELLEALGSLGLSEGSAAAEVDVEALRALGYVE